MSSDGVVFLSYEDTLDLLSAAEAMEICAEVYRMPMTDQTGKATAPVLYLSMPVAGVTTKRGIACVWGGE